MQIVAKSSHQPQAEGRHSSGRSLSKSIAADIFPNDIRCYRTIAIVLFASFSASIAGIVIFHLRPAAQWLSSLFSPMAIMLAEMYFWAALGGTAFSYKFFAKDKDANEVESLKKRPKPGNLRYPNTLDVILYAQRVLFSGALGVIASILLISGLGYFDLGLDPIDTKKRMAMVLFSFLAGFFQNDFLGFLSSLRARLMPAKQNSNFRRKTH